jgi:hypothetical protein
MSGKRSSCCEDHRTTDGTVASCTGYTAHECAVVEEISMFIFVIKVGTRTTCRLLSRSCARLHSLDLLACSHASLLSSSLALLLACSQCSLGLDPFLPFAPALLLSGSLKLASTEVKVAVLPEI